jgi:hypothetical protein
MGRRAPPRSPEPALHAAAFEAFSRGSWLDTVRVGAADYVGELFQIRGDKLGTHKSQLLTS